MNRIRRSRIFLLSLLSFGVLLTGLATGGCQTNSHSQGLLEEKNSGGVSDPYIVRDPGQKPTPTPATTQPANQSPAQ